MIKTRVITAIPLILVNIVAVSGQYAFLRDHLPWPKIGVVIFALALESVALYLAYMAHQALVSLDSSMRLRLGAISFGILAGILNYSHYAVHGRPTFVAVATGIMSASSPWLWAIYSRRQSRDRMLALGLIEPGAVRLGMNRWVMFPGRSFRVYRNAAWNGIREPGQAITEYEALQAATQASEPEPEPEPEPVPVVIPASVITPLSVADMSKAAAIGAAFDALGQDASGPAVTHWLAERGMTVTAGYVRTQRSRNARVAIASRRDSMRAIAGNGTTE